MSRLGGVVSMIEKGSMERRVFCRKTEGIRECGGVGGGSLSRLLA
jgi:hypothetical protein